MALQNSANADGLLETRRSHDDKALSSDNNVLRASKDSCSQAKKVNEKRRFSQRLLEIPEVKRPFYGELEQCPRREIGNGHVNCSSKIIGTYLAETSESDSESNSTVLDADAISCSDSLQSNCELSEEDEMKWLDCSPHTDESSAYANVKETIRMYNTLYLQAVQEDTRCSIAAGKSNHNEIDLCKERMKTSHKQPDLKALNKMKTTKLVLYPKKRFGNLPGIDVGYQFYSRAEMAALGFHSNWLGGIDYIGTSADAKGYKGHTFPLATTIVMSGQYEDNDDNNEVIIYTGQCGNDLLGKKHQVKDRELVLGNLALKNNCDQAIPVRVLRGHRSISKIVEVYTYNGLYMVVDYWPCKGYSGFTVFKYQLRRIKGQPQLTTNQVKFVNGSASDVPPSPTSGPRVVVCNDISEGQEKFPIRVINEIDDTSLPAGFTYSKSIQLGEGVRLPPNAAGCKCKGNCTNPNFCACARLNGLDFPYVKQDGGRLKEAQDVVFECGPNCGCGPECTNRISQREIKYRLEIFRTPNKGWGTRSLDFIPSGAPVCEYTGVLRRTDDIDGASVNDYIFEIDGWQTMQGIGGRERRLGDVSASLVNTSERADGSRLEDGSAEFCIDAGSIGNVARFINHSCDPNLFVQCVFSTHHDLRLARVVLFAGDSIFPGQELTYDYAYPLGSVLDSDGNVQELVCHCGASVCRKRLY